MIDIPDGVQQQFQQAVDDIINNITGRDCTIYFPPLEVPCPAIPQVGDISDDFWVTGDPLEVHAQQLCPLCNGTNYISQETSMVITMAIYWKASQFSNDFPADFRKQEGVIQTKGYCTDLPNVLNCTRFEAFNDLGTDRYRFKLFGEPVIPGKVIPSRYFYALWTRC